MPVISNRRMKKPGDLLMQATPYVHVLSQKQRGIRCDFCFTLNDNLKKCTACKLQKYCNTKCQRSDWSIHKEECPCLQRVSPKIPLDSVRLMLRLIFKHKVADFGKSVEENPGWRDFTNFESHVEEIRADQERCNQLSQIVYTLTALLGGADSLPAAEEVLTIFGKMTINSFTVCDDEMQSIGVAIYLSASLLDHSCTPNAVVTFQGSKLQVRAVADILDPLPNNILISYIDQLSTSADRGEQLRAQYYFDCQCTRCHNKQLDFEMRSIKCQSPGTRCKGYHPTEDDIQPCSLCGYDVTPMSHVKDQIHKFFSACTECLQLVKDSKDAKHTLSVCEDFINEHCAYFTPHNISCLKILDKAFDAAIDTESWEKAVKYGAMTVHSYRNYYPSNSPNVGIQLMKLGKIELYLQKCQQALKSLQQAEKVLCIAHGKSSVIYDQLSQLIQQCTEELRVGLEFAVENC